MSGENDDGRDAASDAEVSVEGALAADVANTEDEELDFSPFDLPDEFGDAGGQIERVIGADGLPVVVAADTRNDIPPLSVKSLVCMGDTSLFVLRDMWGEIKATFERKDVDRSPLGLYRVPVALALKTLEACPRGIHEKPGAVLINSDGSKAADQPSRAEELLMRTTRGGMFGDGAWVPVEPIRPPCKHYARQQTQADFNPEVRVQLRVCTARRSTEGAFMGLRDLAMWACELRDPPRLECIDELDKFDEMKMKQGRNREAHSIFSGPEDNLGDDDDA